MLSGFPSSGGSARKARPASGNAVIIIIAAFVGAVLFTLGAGAVLYLNTQQLTAAAERVQHTQEVISSLQRASLLSERVLYRTHLYLLDKDEDDLNLARSAANNLVTSSVHIRALTADNSNQTTNSQSLSECASRLSDTMARFAGNTPLPTSDVQDCQKTISLMSDQEQMLLTERAAHSKRRLLTSISTEFFLIPVSILSLIILFALLLRDAVVLQRSAIAAQKVNDDHARSILALEGTARESELMTACRNELQLCVDVQQVYVTAATSFSRLLPGSSGCLYMINNSRNHVEAVSFWGSPSHDDFSQPESCCALRSGQPRWRRPGISEIQCAHFSASAPERYHCRPIVAYGNTIGLLYLQCDSDELVMQVNQHMDAVRQLIQITALAIATLNLRAKLENQSIRDSLTGLFNRHFMQISLEREMTRARRRKQIMAVLMLDADHFKRFNDTHGHAAGDAVLKAFADIFLSNIRSEDIACRYGGEEFTIILPDTTVKGACDRAESILTAISQLQVSSGRDSFDGFSVSIGIAFFPGDGETAEELLQHADAALYDAKHNGRNQVCLYERAFSAK
ncbi:diguanylate cyclase [Occallatibacter savannae]|uniref:sensor domain-containing diguanylate cyclase n=1 Tax=Occallatibacter savannae TaxID=1002691 RepID=UPI000D695F1C|nr:diguanylate cyclase [Occallatibacter savannae]